MPESGLFRKKARDMDTRKLASSGLAIGAAFGMAAARTRTGAKTLPRQDSWSLPSAKAWFVPCRSSPIRSSWQQIVHSAEPFAEPAVEAINP
jgi:hypothetical protein